MLSVPFRRVVMLLALMGLLGAAGPAAAQQRGNGPNLDLEERSGGEPRNVVFILVDDHRYDAMSYMGHPFVETPHMDALAEGGAHFANAFVTTSLCSPSRASILTGQYMHTHGVMDNNTRAREGSVFFPEYLQRAGYQTAFVGKWHMGGGSDEPRPGFDHWVSFRGQGRYLPPENREYTWNVNGERVPQEGYVTDELTDYALDWLENREAKDRPFFLYLSHKAVHANFTPAERHAGRYADEQLPRPETMADTPENYEGKPMWLKNQRNSWHGVDFPYHGRLEDKGGLDELYRRYCESILAVDDSVGRVMQYLRDNGLAEDTLVVYMGDNGFQWGEHGLIDKRTAYAASIRVPMIAHCPDLIEPGTVVDGVVANIDIGPTILNAARLQTPENMQGRSFLELAAGEMDPEQWRDYLLYEYYWEWNFPHTPTTFALRGDRYKFIQYHGIWDTDELYDIRNDPHETTNLIRDPDHREVVNRMRRELHRELESTGGAQVSFSLKRGHGANKRDDDGSKAADFPPYTIIENEN